MTQEAQRILGHTVGREMTATEIDSVSGGWWVDPDPDYTMPIMVYKGWVYGDYNGPN